MQRSVRLPYTHMHTHTHHQHHHAHRFTSSCLNVNQRIKTHPCTETDVQIDLYMYTTYTSAHITHTYPLPNLIPDGQSKVQSCGTLRARSISPRDSDFPAELFTCTTMAHSHSIWCYVLGRDRGTDRQTDREEARERERESWHRDTAPHSGVVLYRLQKARGDIKKEI